MSFASIPDRQNEERILREWFDNLRDAGINLESILGGGIIAETAIACADGVTAQNVTGLVFDKTVYRAATIVIHIYRTSNLLEVAETVHLEAIYKPTEAKWKIYEIAGGGEDDAGVDFLIDETSGQVKYTSSTLGGGTYASTLSKLYFKATGTFNR